MKSNLLLLVALFVVSSLLAGCGAGKSIKVNYETIQEVTIDEAKRTKAAGEAFVGIAEAFFADRYQSSPSPLPSQENGAAPAPLRQPEEPPCENCGGHENPMPENGQPVEAVVYLAEDENGEVTPQRIEFKDAAEPGAECTVDAPCLETAEAAQPQQGMAPKKQRSGSVGSRNDSVSNPFGTVTNQIQNNVSAGPGESLLLQYLLAEKLSQREQLHETERTKQLKKLLDTMAEIMNKPLPTGVPQ